MPVRVAEVDAMSAARPIGPAFDGDTLIPQSLLPFLQCLRRNCKREMQWSMSVVRRNGAAGHANGFQGRAPAKQQEHALPADVVGAKARIVGECFQSQHLLVKACRTIEIIDVEAGLDYAVELGHGRSERSPHERSDMRERPGYRSAHPGYSPTTY